MLVVKMRSYWSNKGLYSNMTDVLRKQREGAETDMHRGKHHATAETDWRDRSTVKECQGWLSIPRPKRKVRSRFSPNAFRENMALSTPSFRTSRSQENENKFILL